MGERGERPRAGCREALLVDGGRGGEIGIGKAMMCVRVRVCPCTVCVCSDGAGFRQCVSRWGSSCDARPRTAARPGQVSSPQQPPAAQPPSRDLVPSYNVHRTCQTLHYRIRAPAVQKYTPQATRHALSTPLTPYPHGPAGTRQATMTPSRVSAGTTRV